MIDDNAEAKPAKSVNHRAKPKLVRVDSEPADSVRALKREASLEGFSYYSYLAASETVKMYRKRISDVLMEIGFKDFEYVLAPVGCTETNHIMTTPTETLENYVRGGYAEHDLLAKHATAKTSPIFLSDVADYAANSPFYSESNERTLDLFEMLKKHGYNDYYNLPFRSCVGTQNVMLSVTVRDADCEEFRAWVDERQDMLTLLADIVTYLGLSKFPTYFLGRAALANQVPLTQKQLQLLEKLAKSNVTLQGAADAMCISLDTANKHIAAAKTALGAKTQATAVYRAVASGLSDISSFEW